MSIGTELEHFMEYVFGFCAALDEAGRMQVFPLLAYPSEIYRAFP